MKYLPTSKGKNMDTNPLNSDLGNEEEQIEIEFDEENAVELEEVVDEIVASLPQDEREIQKKVLMSASEEGSSIASTLNISPDVMEFLYGEAYRLYMIRKYDDAMKFFKLLYLFMPLDTRFSLGLASCFHSKKDYEKATAWYMTVSMLDQETPLPFYYLSDCFLKIGEPSMAAGALKIALERAGDNPEFSQLKERMKRMVSSFDTVKGGSS